MRREEDAAIITSPPLPHAIRRLDWRFILPRPADGVYDHLVLLGGFDWLHNDILQIGLARRVSRTIPAPHSADALVVLHDSPVQLEQAISCLRPGGVLYYEEHPTARHRSRRSLRQLGLVSIMPYWVRPHFDAATMLVPLREPHALRWYVRTLVVASTPLQRLASALMCLPLPVNALVERFGRCRAYVARMAPVSTPRHGVILSQPRDRVRSLGKANGHAEAAAEEFVPGLGRCFGCGLSMTEGDNGSRYKQAPTTDNTVPFVLAGGETDTKRVVIFLFPQGSSQPSAVLKVSRYAQDNIDAVTEQAVLARIRPLLSADMRRTVPQPVALVRDGPFVVDVESYSDGRTLSATSGEALTPLRAKHRDMQRVGAWLARFHHETTVERIAWDAAARHRFIHEPLAHYERTFGTTADEQRLFDAVRARAETLHGLPLPLVWQHHNFGEWNVLRTRWGISVIDWEHARTGLPSCDLIHFALYWTLTVRRLRTVDEQQRGFLDLFCAPQPTDATVATARRVMASYLDHLAIDPRFGPLLVVYTWVEKALHSATHTSLGNTRPWNKSVAYVELLAQDQRWMAAA